MMRILVLGGSRQLGGAFVSSAVARGHDLTVFNRGVTNPGRYSGNRDGLRVVHGDRNRDLGVLDSGAWDVVVDTSAYTPATLQTSLYSLGGRVGHYLFVSTVAVYRPLPSEVVDEDSPLLDPKQGPPGDSVSAESYGFLKVQCEELLQASGIRHLIVRPGVITGPEDHTARFKFWVDEIMTHDDVIVPGDPGRVVQLIDSRDVAGWMLEAVERSETGTFNCAGPARSFSDILDRCREVLDRPSVRFHWLTPAQLSDRGGPEASLWPLWNDGIDDRYSSRRGAHAGLRWSPLADTIRAVRDAPIPPKFTVPENVRERLVGQGE